MNFKWFKKKKYPKNNELIVKLNQDSIMRILVTHFQEGDFGESWGHGELLGTPDKDLRFIGVFRNDADEIDEPFNYDINEIDATHDFDDDGAPTRKFINGTNVALVSTVSLGYRGIERILIPSEMVDDKKKNITNKLLELYFKSIDITYNRNAEADVIYNELLPIYKTFKDNHVPCEMIVFDTKPVEAFHHAELEFLGYDICNQNCKSLITELNVNVVSEYLNDNGLCRDISDVESIKKELAYDLLDFEWKAYYVYCLADD